MGLVVSEEKVVLSFSYYKCMGANDPRGVASLGPRGLIGRIYVGDHLTLLHTKYVAVGLIVSEKKGGFKFFFFFFFFFFFIISVWELITPGVWPV